MWRIIFSSDVHGNLKQYKRLVVLANRKSAKFLFIGGDLFPKARDAITSKPVKTVAAQRDYFENSILPIFKECTAHVYISFGNADFYANVQHLRNLCNRDDSNVTIVDSEVVPLGDTGYYLLAYAGVPFSSHHLKDFERFDTCNPKSRDNLTYSLEGQVSITNEEMQTQLLNNVDTGANLDEIFHIIQSKTKYGDGVRTVTFPKLAAFAKQFSIETQLSQVISKFKEEHPDRPDIMQKCIWLVHGPPLNTNLDQCKTGAHVGSMAVKQLIQKHEPLLTLHGHIHEAVDKSGNYIEQIGKSVCCASGNFPRSLKVSAVICEISDDNNDGGNDKLMTKRVRLAC